MRKEWVKVDKSLFKIDSAKAWWLRSLLTRFRLGFLTRGWWWATLFGVMIVAMAVTFYLDATHGWPQKSVNPFRVYVVLSIMVVFSMGFAAAITLDHWENQRRARVALYDYIEMIRDYSVENIETLKETVVSLQSVHVPIPPAEVPTEQEVTLKTRERETLLKIIYGMAVSKPYSFDPNKRNEAASIIASATAAAGCSVNDDTVRKWLKEASKVIR